MVVLARTVSVCIQIFRIKTKQVVKVSNLTRPHRRRIWTVSVVFARLHQYAAPSTTSKSASAPYPCCPLLSRFVHIDRRTCAGISCMDRPSKLSLHACGSGPHPIHGSILRPTRVHIPNGISIGSAVFARLTVVSGRQTDHVTPSIAI